MQNRDIALSVGRSTSSPETSDATAVRPRHLRARSSSLPGIKLTARDPDDADEATRDEVAQSEGLAARGGDDHVVRDEGHGEGVAAHDEARPLPTDISDRIAIEIYERVFDHITDQFTLFIAASISRSWYPRATHWLYHSISIPSRASYDLLVNQLHTSPRVQRWLRSTHKVTLGYRDGSGSNNSGTPFLDTFPLLFGQACPSLQVLDIGRILRPNPHPTFHRALRQFQHVVSLRLHDAELSNIAQLRRIVCALTCLEELALDDLVLIEPQLSQPDGAMLQDVLSRNPCNIRLKRLRVEAHTSDCIKTFGRMVDWFVCSRICSSLVELVTAFEDGEPAGLAAGHVDRLLQFLGQSLTSFHCENYVELRERSCDLAHNTALRQLTLDFNFHPHFPVKSSDFAQAARELREAFSTVRSSLEHITICFRFELFGYLDEKNFSKSCKRLEADSPKLNDVLVGPYFDALRDVKIEIKAAYNPVSLDQKSAHDFAGGVAPLLRRLFMPWHDRGILAITTSAKEHEWYSRSG